MSFAVSANALRHTFEDISPLLKKVGDGALLAFTTEDNALVITAQSGLVYQSTLTARPDTRATVTVLYQDLSELIPATGEVQVQVSDGLVSFSTDTSYIVLQPAYGVVSKYHPITGRIPQTITDGYLQRIQKELDTFKVVSRTLKREASIKCAPPILAQRYPTIWYERTFDMFNTVMSLQELTVLSRFGPTGIIIESNVLEFHKMGALLAIPRVECESLIPGNRILSNPQTALSTMLPEKLPMLQKYQRAAGAVPVRAYFYSQGLKVQNLNPEFTMTLNIGNTGTTPYVSLNCPVEYLVMMFQVFPFLNMTITEGSNAVMFQEGVQRLIISHV